VRSCSGADCKGLHLSDTELGSAPSCADKYRLEDVTPTQARRTVIQMTRRTVIQMSRAREEQDGVRLGTVDDARKLSTFASHLLSFGASSTGTVLAPGRQLAKSSTGDRSA